MHFDRQLWTFTAGVRLRVAWATLIGLLAVGLGMARLMLLAWLIAEVFAGHGVSIETVRQVSGQGTAGLVISTHRARERDLAATVADLRGLDAVAEVTSVLRIEGE